VDAITVVLSKELGPRKIRVNSINPGMIETEGVHAAGYIEGDFRTWIESQSSVGRIGQTDDISPTAVYLASSDSKCLTGETLRVTGGIL
jgi:3-oxoacyl-[acyl-carrier protein] reductase